MKINARSAQSPPAAAVPVHRHGAITAAVCIALAAAVAAMSSLNAALPDIARSTHASQTQLSWIIDAYSLVFAALLLPAGALGDRYGRRRALLVGLAVFGAGSSVAMTASTATELIGLRAVLGLGAALVMPATLSTITGTFPPARRTRAVSIWAAVAGVAAIIGVVCAGALLEFFSWRSVLGLNVVLAVPDARHHLRIVGPTGVGKTTLITGQILADAGIPPLLGDGAYRRRLTADVRDQVLRDLPHHQYTSVTAPGPKPSDKSARPSPSSSRGPSSP